MKPDQRWFPTSRAERAVWFDNFAMQFAKLGLALGFTQAEIDAVSADNAVVQYSSLALSLLEVQMGSARQFEREIMQGSDNGAEPQLFTTTLPPAPPMVSAGIYERLTRIVARIRLSPTYTPVEGTLLGIIRSNPQSKIPDGFVPKLKLIPSGDAYSFSARCTVGNFDGFQVSYQRGNSDGWETTTTFTRSPVQIKVVPAVPGQPEQISVRVRMVKANEPVSSFSAASTVILTP